MFITFVPCRELETEARILSFEHMPSWSHSAKHAKQRQRKPNEVSNRVAALHEYVNDTSYHSGVLDPTEQVFYQRLQQFQSFFQQIFELFDR